jgi:uncharacterized SAM-dependent methyltransferase
MTKDEATIFIKQIHGLLSSGDMLVTGFDLIKHPKQLKMPTTMRGLYFSV